MKHDKKPNILIIDDEENICRLIKIFLDQTMLFNKVEISLSVSVALLKIKNENFDLIITDYKMSHKTGLEFIEMMTNNFKFRKIRFIIISGYLDNEVLARFIKLKIKHILVKPFARAKLIKTVCDALDIEYKE